MTKSIVSEMATMRTSDIHRLPVCANAVLVEALETKIIIIYTIMNNVRYQLMT